jgi:hypothetical protein
MACDEAGQGLLSLDFERHTQACLNLEDAIFREAIHPLIVKTVIDGERIALYGCDNGIFGLQLVQPPSQAIHPLQKILGHDHALP